MQTCACIDAQSQVGFWDRELSPRGVRLVVLHQDGRGALIYAYRPSRLMQDIDAPGVKEFLSGCGYGKVDSAAAVVNTLRERIAAKQGFPHEIGLFLSYPLADVTGFIQNNGRNFTLCGYWKVYGDASEAARCFARYKTCAQVYLRQFELGMTITQLTIAV